MYFGLSLKMSLIAAKVQRIGHGRPGGSIQCDSVVCHGHEFLTACLVLKIKITIGRRCVICRSLSMRKKGMLKKTITQTLRPTGTST